MSYSLRWEGGVLEQEWFGGRERDELKTQGDREDCEFSRECPCAHADWKVGREVWA